MGAWIEAINKRISTRTYVDKSIEEKDKKVILDLIRSDTVGPFGNRIRFEFLDFTELDKEEIRRPGTYGIIKGASLFIVAATKRSQKAMEDLGYSLEKIILQVTNLGFGTCWIGGTFNRSSFSKRINVTGNEIVPAVCPVGHIREKRAMKEKFIRFIAKSDGRKPWGKLFFDGGVDRPLTQDKAREYSIPLESVRIAPSASNRQPWRVVREGAGNVFHFYLKRTKGYESIIREFKIQNIDMGIAMCHFELSALEMGLSGQWEDEKPGLDAGNMEYVVSWVG
jgi:hypothetical protein